MHDVVVIGAGSAGAVVAARASENPHLDVCLLEAGPDYAELAHTPFDLVNGHDNSYRDHDWDLRYRPTEFSRERPLPRGRVTGGSSAVNTTIALRGMREDYDAWGAELGAHWSFASVLPLFKRLERDLDFGAAPWHGDAGPISIRRYPWEELTPSHQAFLETARALGYPDCPDANDPEGFGAGPHPMNKLGRTRISTAVGYLAPARIRPNLHIQPHTHVRRLLARGRRIVAAEVERNGAIEQIQGKLFVCAAGAIHTPCLLVRSGLGPGAALASLGIDVLVDLPGVGENLCDHPAVPVVCVARDPALAKRELPLIQTILRYTAAGSGERNDLQIELLTFGPDVDGKPSFSVAAVLEQCESRGRLRVTSADPHEAPAIEPALCSDPRDRERLAQCLFEARRFVKTKPLADLVERIAFPDPARALDLEGARELCRRSAGSGFHPCGTARMGRRGEQGAVCDPHALVQGVDNLLIADASLLPSVPRANTNLTCVMLGEQIGEWIRTRAPWIPL